MSLLRNSYTALTWVGAPLVLAYLRWRSFRGREDKTRVRERRGFTNVPRPNKPLVWIHAVSVGESIVALTLIQAILKHSSHVHFLLTTTTTSSATIVEKRLTKNTIHQFCPVDTPQAVYRFLEHWKPDLAVWIESEFWPNLMHGTQKRGIPTVLLNGRISLKSFSNWKKLKGMIAALLSRLDLCAVQSEEQASFFHILGASNISIMGSAKVMTTPLNVDLKKYEALKRQIGKRPVWLAASSHPGEEELVFKAHQILKKDHPDLLTLLVPRHIERAHSLQRLASKEGLVSVLQTEATSLTGVDLYIGNTLGELATLYALAPVVLMGATFVEKGGHNPIEAAQLGAFVLYGPHTFNNHELYKILSSLELSEKVQDGDQLAHSIRPWFTGPKESYKEPLSLKIYREEKLSNLMSLLTPHLKTLRMKKE
ncbi:MAG: 3-deoxy-D-manno-octulosonic acid transferase [Alphaproteobacteria bacterium]|nr:3-deoxy-D-manno-octulosonic acid transferase [Alphaproteobacteria bacterium]